MIVVPLEDHDEALYCDELNASYYDFFERYDEGYSPGHRPYYLSLEIESPRTVVEQARPASLDPQPRFIIPTMTDLIQSSTVSAARRSCHKRSRNRALGNNDFSRLVLPHLGEALRDHWVHNGQVDDVSPLLKETGVAIDEERTRDGGIEAEC
jgi:hypothetical protein